MSLDCSSNNLTLGGTDQAAMVSLLGAALSRTSRVATLALGANAIGDEALPALTAALASNTTLTHLDVRSMDHLSTR